MMDRSGVDLDRQHSVPVAGLDSSGRVASRLFRAGAPAGREVSGREALYRLAGNRSAPRTPSYVCQPVIQARCLLGHASLDESCFLGSLLINFSSTLHARSLHPTRGVDFANASFLSCVAPEEGHDTGPMKRGYRCQATSRGETGW